MQIKIYPRLSSLYVFWYTSLWVKIEIGLLTGMAEAGLNLLSSHF